MTTSFETEEPLDELCDCDHCCGVPAPAPTPRPARGLSPFAYELLGWTPGDEELP